MTFPLLALAVVAVAASSAAAAHYSRRFLFAALAGGAAILLLHGWAYFRYTSDDAYISYRYAANLADGRNLVWNPGEYVEGYSNFLWVLVLALFDKAGADIVPTARWLGFALAVVALGGCYALARQLLPGERGAWAGFASVLLVAASGPFALWAFAGLETSLMAVLVAGAVILHLRESDGARVPVSGAVWAFASMARPDVPLLVAVSGLFKLGEGARRIRGRERGWDVELRALAQWVALFAIVFVPYFAWRYETYGGYLFPNTYYAKVGGGLDQYERGLYYLAVFTREHALWLLALVPVAAVAGTLRAARLAYVLALVLAWSAYVVYVGGDSLVRFRLFAPLLPLIYPLVAVSAAALLPVIAPATRPRWALPAGLAAAAGALLLFTLQSSATDPSVEVERRAVEERAEIGRWLRANVPPDTVIAVIPAGAIPYESRLVTIDMLGINDERIAHRELPLGTFAAGHEKYDSEYVLERQPDIIILTDALDDAPRTRDAYTGLSSGIILARLDMLQQPRLWDEYVARSVEVREGKWLNLLVRPAASAVIARTENPARPP